MQEEDIIPVNLWLSGRSYRIKVKRDEAEQVRKAVKEADEKIFELKQKYSGKDDQDFLAMCLLMYASNSMGTQANTSDPNIAVSLEQLAQRIDEVLSK